MKLFPMGWFNLAVRSIAGRLALWFTISSVALLLVVGNFAYWTIESHLVAEDREHLRTKARLIAALMSDALPPAEALRKVRREARFFPDSAVFVRILAADGSLIEETPGMAVELPVASFPAQHDSALVRGKSGTEYWAVSEPIRNAPGSQRIQVASLANDDAPFLAPYQGRLWAAMLFAFMLSGVAGYRIARRGIQPVRGLIDTARQVGASALDKRIDIRPLPSELVPLGKRPLMAALFAAPPSA